jgi:hypothetical protein
MNNIKYHDHPFLLEMRETLDQLNRYSNKSYSVAITSERSDNVTNIKFNIYEDKNPIYMSVTRLTNTEIDKSAVDVVALAVDKHITYRVKDDFFMAGITHFSKCAEQQRGLYNQDFLITKGDKDE